MFRKFKFTTGILLFLLLSLYPIDSALAKPAILKLSPSSGEYTVGDSYSLEVRVDSQGEAIAALDVKINYDSSVLEYQAINYDNSPLEAPVGSPNISAGSIQVARMTYTSGGYTGDGKVMSITFKGLKATSSSTSVNFVQNDCQVNKYGTGENLLTSVINGSYTIKSAEEPTPEPEPEPEPTPKPEPTFKARTEEGKTVVVDKSKSVIKTDKSSALADGKEVIKIIVMVMDKNGKVIKNLKPKFSISGSENKVSDPILVGNEWMADLTSTKAEEKTITVKVDKTTLGTIKVTFTEPTAPAPEEEVVPPEEEVAPTAIPKPPISITKLPALVSPYMLYAEGGAALVLTILLYYLIRKRRGGL